MWDRQRRHDVRERLFGGDGVVRVWSLAAQPLPPFAAVLACELDPSSCVGAHVQQYFAELVIGIAGRGEVEVDGVPRPFLPGSVVELPLGHTLAIRNGSLSEPLRYLIVKGTPTEG